jgi:cell wall assembly regulator SMI1
VEIKHLNKLKDAPKTGGFEMEGASETEIQQLEEKLSVKLPQAYKEFLYLAGKFDDILGDWNSGFRDTFRSLRTQKQ